MKNSKHGWIVIGALAVICAIVWIPLLLRMSHAG
jgi:hypothetical protein